MVNSNAKEVIRKIFKKNKGKSLEVSKLIKITLPETRSEIVKKNGSTLFIAKVSSLEGLFYKENSDTRKYGRVLCDQVKESFSCSGFFTSDELPRYGINRRETRKIFEKIDKKEGDLVLVFSYDKKKSLRILEFLVNEFRSELGL
ncbi:hypothetical protein JW710_03435 [Candidatus Dojkabacteria bacterium]|nr:hypothetical protein [Candidatus Dojkabacteria bacterium]